MQPRRARDASSSRVTSAGYLSHMIFRPALNIGTKNDHITGTGNQTDQDHNGPTNIPTDNHNRGFTSAILTDERQKRDTSPSRITVRDVTNGQVVMVKHDRKCYGPNTATNRQAVNEPENAKRSYDKDGSKHRGSTELCGDNTTCPTVITRNNASSTESAKNTPVLDSMMPKNV